MRDEEKGTIAWRIKFRDGRVKNFLSPITTQPWGTKIPDFRNEPEPSDDMRNSQLLAFEPKYIRMDDGDIHTLESNGLKFKKGVYY
jgi:adenylylsulfate reductase subunit B